DKMRRVQTIRESKDLVTWTPQEVFLRPDEQDSPITEFYLMKAFPYAQGYAGLLMKYCADPAKPKEHSGIVATELVVSHDARTWQRPFRDTDLVFWAYTAPFVREGKLHFVVGKTGAIEQLTYRPRRLTGVAAHGATDGVFVTQPFAMPATDLAIDADTSSGWIEVEALDTEKTSTEGFGPARVEKVDGEVIPLVWEGLRSLDLPLAECRLRFKLHNATLYAITTMSESNAEETPSES
ncbi:MAG: hypothetical protein QG656_195, partial [Candidatus Hydrogenedentes bacterium]|nr:hypothetical protein [Candidatus Hydrogenedentota bacterium]